MISHRNFEVFHRFGDEGELLESENIKGYQGISTAGVDE
jgi:hypothetical protein